MGEKERGRKQKELFFRLFFLLFLTFLFSFLFISPPPPKKPPSEVGETQKQHSPPRLQDNAEVSSLPYLALLLLFFTFHTKEPHPSHPTTTTFFSFLQAPQTSAKKKKNTQTQWSRRGILRCGLANLRPCKPLPPYAPRSAKRDGASELNRLQGTYSRREGRREEKKGATAPAKFRTKPGRALETRKAFPSFFSLSCPRQNVSHEERS